ncbi:MAG: 3-isopropylmalate dehydrogenase [Cyclobacteriaceae bacterium]|nr:3-isopropylmalate dehydrogenase [Cyclobacteriaceae bacterium]
MKKNIAVLPGDGIGPEVITEAVKVLSAIGEKYQHEFIFNYGDIGASAIDKSGVPLPDETIKLCQQADSILFGAIGDPKYDNNPNANIRPEQGLLALRKTLGLFANIRPVAVYESLIHRSPLKEEIIRNTDLVIFRELTGGIYFGKKGKDENGSYDHCVYTAEEIDRITIMAFKAAATRKKKITLVDKANVLETSRLWRERVQTIAASYPEITLELMFVDNAAMQIIQNPSSFDVILTENMFGDILSDAASVIPGSMGLLPSASVGKDTSLFEPIHGSYPQAAGKNIANPLATILSAAMMLESFELFNEAQEIVEMVNQSLKVGSVTSDINSESGLGTSDVGNYIAESILQSSQKEVNA